MSESLELTSTLTQHIVQQCAKGPGNFVVPDCLHPGAYLFVKRAYALLADEARTQAYLYNQTLSSSTAPRIPKVHGVINDASGTYLVMEHVSAPSFGAWVDQAGIAPDERERRFATAVAAISDAIAWLIKCPIPESDQIGPVGGGTIQHAFFGVDSAPLPFVNATALEKYINKALVQRPGRPTDKISLSDEPLIFTHSDIHLDNFLWDPVAQQVWLVDCQGINVLPQSFFSYCMHKTYPTHLIKALVPRLSVLPVSPKLRLLYAANHIVILYGSRSLGLDAYGNRVLSTQPSPPSPCAARPSK